MANSKIPISAYYFGAAMILLLCGYPIVLLMTGVWQLAYCAGGSGILLLGVAVFKQRLEGRNSK